jgi:hypothetical protein
LISKETIEGLRAAYHQYVNGPANGSTSRDRLETWIEAVLDEYDLDQRQEQQTQKINADDARNYWLAA